MSAVRLVFRSFRPSSIGLSRPLSTTRRLFAEGEHPNVDEHRKAQIEKPLGPHMTNTNSTIANEMPSVGARKVPPELISSIDGDFVPKDSVPENTERMTGGTQKGEPDSGPNAEMETKDLGERTGELGVGQMEGAAFKVEPLRRSGEDANTMRARLVYQSRKRGTLESDLLMSTFADTHLEHMSMSQMAQYDLFLDENDWDIYYWATQEPTPTSRETAEGAGAGPEGATSNAQGHSLKPGVEPSKEPTPQLQTDQVSKPAKGEWAQTVGTFKPAYRPVPARWKNSEILSMLRRHVKERSAGGVHNGQEVGGDTMTPDSMRGRGMAFMPEVRNMDA